MQMRNKTLVLYLIYAVFTAFTSGMRSNAQQSNSGVAVIDISPILLRSGGRPNEPRDRGMSSESNSNEASYAACVSQVLAALTDKGLFLATHFGWSDSFVEDSFAASRALFSLPEAERMAVQMGPQAMRGYIPFGRESGLKDSVFEPKEGYALGFDAPIIEAATVAATGETQQASGVSTGGGGASYLRAANVWPAALSASHRHTLERLYERKVLIASSLTRAVLDAAQATGDSEAYTDAAIWGPDGAAGAEISVLRLFHYLRSPPENIDAAAEAEKIGESGDHKAVLGSSAHTDWGLLTVILQDGAGGLEFLPQNGEGETGTQWTPVPALEPRSLVINGGDLLRLLRPSLVSPIHRVVAPTLSDRTSFVFFFYPAYSLRLRIPIPKVGAALSGVGKGQALLGQEGAPKELFNTLLVPTPEEAGAAGSANGADGSSESSGAEVEFGPYIIQKWTGVRNY